MTEDQWYYYHRGERQGPVTEEQLKQLASEGKLDPTDNVSKPGMKDWVQAGNFEAITNGTRDALQRIQSIRNQK